MSKDPFAVDPDPADEDTSRPAEAGPAEKKVVGGDDFHPYKFTFKAGSGYEAEWFTAAYKTLDNAYEDLTGETSRLFADVLKAGNKVAAFFRSGGPGVQSRGSSGGSSNGKPAGATEPPAWARKQISDCEHGRAYKTSLKKDKSGYWHAADCSAGVCDRQWLNAPK